MQSQKMLRELRDQTMPSYTGSTLIICDGQRSTAHTSGGHSEKSVNGLPEERLREEPLLTGKWFTSRIFSPRHRSFPTLEGPCNTAVGPFSPRRCCVKVFRSV